MQKLVLLLSLLVAVPGEAGRLHPEAYYQKNVCRDMNGVEEVVMESGARCDCLTATHAVEFDFANKWAEAIGQALHYSAQTGKRGGIVLIMENPKRDRKYLERLSSTVKAHGLAVDVWTTQ